MQTGYVVCAACGARIKADRTHCLRCEAPLPARSPARAASAPSDRRTRLVAAAGAAVGLCVVGLLWLNRPSTTGIQIPPPVAPLPANVQASVPGGAPASVAGAETPTLAPVTFLDSSRAADAAFNSGNFQNARVHFEDALQKNPNDPEALNSLGLTLERVGDIPGAIARFERAVDLAADKWAYHFNLAHALVRQSNWDRAVAEYRRAAELFPEDYATQFNLAMTLQKQGDDRAAIPEFEKAIALAPGEPSFHVALGNSLAKTRRFTDAQREFRLYLELDPAAPDAAKVKAHIQTLAAAAAPPPAAPPATPPATPPVTAAPPTVP